MKDSLIWDDEIPDKFNGDSYEKVGDLLIARGPETGVNELTQMARR